MQFTGDHATGGGTPVPLTAGGDNAYTAGDLFNADPTSVLVSSVAAGVAGNTLQGGEVLDMNFYTFNPESDITQDSDTTASGMFLKFDGIGASDDLVVILKLVDPDDSSIITKAIVIDSSDIFKFGDTLPAGYNVTLDNNDGLVIIESNDYNTGSENYVIYGAQVLSSTESVTGSGINLNPATGAGGGSSGTEAFTPVDPNNTADGDVLKITDLGFVTTTTSTQAANLQFNVTVADFDGDPAPTQTLDVTIAGGTTFTGTTADEVIQGSSADDSMTGGGGNDIFDFNSMTDAADTVIDFHIGNTLSDANADVLDIDDILPVATQGATSELTLSGYVTLDTATSPGNTIVKVDANGGGDGFQTLVTLNGVTGVTLQQLLDNHQLIT